MSTAKFLDVNPVLPVTNMAEALRFYTQNLGFHLLSSDPAGIDIKDQPSPHPSYAVVGRDHVRLHLQSHDPENAQDRTEPLHIRFLIDDVDGLYAEYQSSGAIPSAGFSGRSLADTPWGTREFGMYDPDRNGLFFYRDR
jgi:catechol 2,3-dioxygenase-like lactoylglutathione lyase family enzyme